MVSVDVKHHVYLLCSVHEDKRCGQLAGESVAAADTVIEHLSPFVQEMRTRGVANLQVSGDATNRKPVSLCSGDEDKRWGQFAGEWRCNKQETCLPLFRR